MHMPRAAHALVPLLATLALAGCPSLSTDPELPRILMFEMSGPLSGQWRAEGRTNVSSPGGYSWADGALDAGVLTLTGEIQPNGVTFSRVEIVLPSGWNGSIIPFGDECGGPHGCASFTATFGARVDGAAPPAIVCTLQGGSIGRFDTAAGRARGTFSGQGSCVTAGGEVLNGFAAGHGFFDVPVGTRRHP
jgi:hypothetical protein